MEASLRKTTDGNGMVKWLLHTHFELLRGVPTRIDVTPAGGGQYDERAMLASVIESDRLYVTDRGYAKYALFNQIVAAKSSYVCRLRDNSVWTVWTGKKPTLRTYEMICFYFTGLADEDALMAHIEKLKPQDA